MSITSISVKRPTLVVVLFSVLVLFGLISYQSLPMELLPKISFPVMTVVTTYPGASPSEVESAVTKEIENAVSTIENLSSIKSISQEGVSIVLVEMNYGTNIDLSMQAAQRKINAVVSKFPEAVKDPVIEKFSFSDLPIMRLGATSNMEERAFVTLFENRIEPQLTQIPGVAKVSLVGGLEREIKINVDNDKLNHYNLSILQVSQAIAKGNLNFPTGSMKNTNQQILLRLSGRFSDITQLANLPVVTLRDGSIIYLKDVAEIYDSAEDVKTISRINGRNSLGVLISKTSDGNTVAISRAVKEKIKEIEAQYKSNNLKIVVAQDSATFTKQAADSVLHDLVIAIILVAVIMLFFLHNMRNALIVMVAIPTSIIATFTIMALAGFSINLMTLLAMSLVIGILVDDSIVVLENIHSHMEQGKSAWQAASDTWKEIGISVTSITLVIVVVFLPIALVQGIVADILFQFSIVVVSSTLLSWLVSFTLTPWLASRFTKLTHLNKNLFYNKPLVWFENFINQLKELLKTALIWSLHHKKITVTSIMILVVASFMLMKKGFIGTEFVANGDNGEFLISVEMLKDAPIQQTNLTTQAIEEFLKKDTNIVNVFTTVGKASNSTATTPYISEINVKLVPSEQRTLSSTDYSAKVKAHLQTIIPGAKISASPVSMVGNNEAPVQFVIKGSNMPELLAYSEKVKKIIQSTAGTTEVKASVEGGNPEITIDVDRKKMADLGLTLDIIGGTMQNAYTGTDQTKFLEGDYEYPIRVQLDEFDRKNMEDVKNLSFVNNKGEIVRLEQFATIQSNIGPDKLERKDKISSITINAYVVGRAVGTVGDEIEAQFKNLPKSENITIEKGGNLKNQAEAFQSLFMALIASILLVYLIMVALYDNYVYPLVVMFSVPVALIGAFLALALARVNLSIFGMLGLIMLIGLVIKNAILIVDFANHLKEKGASSYDAIVEATLSRFRPILMTTIAMIIAMLPIALAKGAGAEWKNGLAWILIGGLTSSMILTLLIVPDMYLAVDQISAWFAKRKKKKTAAN